LVFEFSESIIWPTKGPLSCYTAFLEQPAGLSSDVITVELKTGLPVADEAREAIMDSGDGIRWSRSGGVHVVEKILPHISTSPIWVLRIHMNESSAELYFSDVHMAAEECHGDWPVAAPRYPLDQHMTMHFLAPLKGALVHSAGIRCAGKGFMCLGVSGAGKTTLSRLLAEEDGFEILTDDRVILRSRSNGMMMHGTPWSGEGRYATSGMAPLSALFFLKQDTEVRAQPLDVKQVVSRFMAITSVPWFDERLMTETMRTLGQIAEHTPAYDLHFTKTAETVDLVADIVGAGGSAPV
jgi:hypothetical protein